MATRAVLTPESASFPTTNFPQLVRDGQSRMALGFDAATAETAFWTLVAPAGLVTPVTAVLTYRMASATSGNIIMTVAVEAIGDGDALNTASAASFDTANTTGAVAVPGTAGHIKQTTVTLTNNDAIVAGEYVRISVVRDAANGSDTAAGDLQLLAVEFADAA